MEYSLDAAAEGGSSAPGGAGAGRSERSRAMRVVGWWLATIALLIAFEQIVTRLARDGDARVSVGGWRAAGLVAVLAVLAIPYRPRRHDGEGSRRALTVLLVEFVAAAMVAVVGYALVSYHDGAALGGWGEEGSGGLVVLAVVSLVAGLVSGTRSFLPTWLVLIGLGAAEQALLYDDAPGGISPFADTISPYAGGGISAYLALPFLALGALARLWVRGIIERASWR